MKLSLSHWYPGSGVVLIVSIPDLCPLSYFVEPTKKSSDTFQPELRSGSSLSLGGPDSSSCNSGEQLAINKS